MQPNKTIETFYIKISETNPRHLSTRNDLKHELYVRTLSRSFEIQYILGFS